MRDQSSFFRAILIAACCSGADINGLYGLCEALAQEQTDAKAALVNAVDKVADAPDEIVVTGVVLKPDGRPAERAVIRSAVPVTTALETRLGRKIVTKICEATAGEDGRFTISISKAPLQQIMTSEAAFQNHWKSTPIVALLKGFGPAHVEIGDIDEGTPITLKLVEDLPIRGQLIDLEGQPLRGVRVTIAEVQMLTGDDPSRLLTSLKGQGGDQAFILAPQFQKQWGLEHVELRLIDIPENVVTDQNGAFEIHGLGKDRVIHFALEGGEVAWQTITAISREMEPIQLGTVMRQRNSTLVYGSKFHVAVPPTRPVEGIVVDSKTEKPLAGASVEMQRPRSHRLGRAMAMHTGRPLTVMKTITDEEGRFRLLGMAKTEGNSLLVFPPDNQPYFHEEIDVRDQSGIDSIKLTIKLHRGIWIKGKITEKETKEPIVGARVHYYPSRKNSNAANIAMFNLGLIMETDLDRFKTGSDGSYRLIGLPGPAVVAAISGFRPYRTGVGVDQLTIDKDEPMDRQFNSFPRAAQRARQPNSVREVNPSADEQEVQVDLEFESGVSIKIQLVDSDGGPVRDVKAWGPGVRPFTNPTEGFPDGIVAVENLGPNDQPILYAYHFDRNLGLKFQLQPPYEPGREFKFVLEPMAIVTGRLFEDGAPMERVSIGRSYRMDGGGIVSLSMPPGIATNQEGRFRCSLIPGHEYELLAQGRTFRPRAVIAGKLNVRAGETVDLGDLEFSDDRFGPMKPKEPIEKPKPKNEPE